MPDSSAATDDAGDDDDDEGDEDDDDDDDDINGEPRICRRFPNHRRRVCVCVRISKLVCVCACARQFVCVMCVYRQRRVSSEASIKTAVSGLRRGGGRPAAGIRIAAFRLVRPIKADQPL